METQGNSLEKPAEGAHLGTCDCLRDNDRLNTILDATEEAFLIIFLLIHIYSWSGAGIAW